MCQKQSSEFVCLLCLDFSLSWFVCFLFNPVRSFCRWWGRGNGGRPWEAGGVHRAARFVPPWRSLPPGGHAAVAGKHSPETHIAHRLHTPQHTQHCLWTVTSKITEITFHLVAVCRYICLTLIYGSAWIDLFACFRNKSGIWGWRSEKSEVVSGYEAKVSYCWVNLVQMVLQTS